MQKFKVFLGLFVVVNLSFAQGENPVFPDSYLGSYQGTLNIYLLDGKIQEVPMEFHLTRTDAENRYAYTLVYDGQAREYTLVVLDKEKGLYELDENNGIILPTRFANNILFSFFQVDSTFLSSRLAFSGKNLNFEILSTQLGEKVETGKNLEMDIYGFPIKGLQQASLTRVETSSD
ncbi:MAG: hypothetical protein AAGA10_27060 [Bacteroidota bacterium]